MKRLIVILLLAATSAVHAAGKDIKIGVSGMVCGFCAQGITKKFKAEPAIESIDVNLNEKAVRLKLKDNQNLDDNTIKKILQDAGYNVTSIERA